MKRTYALYATKGNKSYFAAQDEFVNPQSARDFWSEEIAVLKYQGWTVQLLIKTR